MQSSLAAITAVALLLSSAPTFGETFRCGSKLVSQEISVADLVTKCGQPDHRSATETEPVVRSPNGALRRLPPIRTETWTYERGPQAFSMVVTIVDGKITRMEPGK
jgi:hypothetical protein